MKQIIAAILIGVGLGRDPIGAGLLASGTLIVFMLIDDYIERILKK